MVVIHLNKIHVNRGEILAIHICISDYELEQSKGEIYKAHELFYFRFQFLPAIQSTVL